MLAPLRSIMVGKEENGARHPERGRGGTEALSSVGSPGRPQLLLLCTVARLGGQVQGWFGKGAEAEDGGSLLMPHGMEIPGRKVQRMLGEAPRSRGRRSTWEASGRRRDKSVRTVVLSPASGPKAWAGERDPCPDPSPSQPARLLRRRGLRRCGPRAV